MGKSLLNSGYELVGFCDGFEGVFSKKYRTIDLRSIQGIHQEAGTFLGTSNRSKVESREAEFMDRFQELDLEGLVVAGGDGTFASLAKISHASGQYLPVIGVPKTIDNDLSGTELTFGYDTACSVVAESVDALRMTADAHSRVMVVETMGRTAGWIALGGGLASYSEVLLIPERPFDRSALKEFISARKESGARGLMVTIAEGAHAIGESAVVSRRVLGAPEEIRLGGVGEQLARWIEAECAWEARAVVLGHLQRSRAPTTTDRFLTLGMGVLASELVRAGRWGEAVVFRSGKLVPAPITELQAEPKRVDPEHPYVGYAKSLGVFI